MSNSYTPYCRGAVFFSWREDPQAASKIRSFFRALPVEQQVERLFIKTVGIEVWAILLHHKDLLAQLEQMVEFPGGEQVKRSPSPDQMSIFSFFHTLPLGSILESIHL